MEDDPVHDLLGQVFAPWTKLPDKIDVLTELLVDMQGRLARHDRSIKEMRKHMAATDDLVARLGAATDELAADLQRLADEVSNGDATVAAKFEPLVARLEAMGADNDNPIPDAPPADQPPADEPPADGGDVPAE